MRHLKNFCYLWQLFFVCIAFAQDTSPVVRVGAYENYPKIYTDDNGRITGLFPDILNAVAVSEGFEIRYVQGTWTECLDRLERGEIDIMADVAISPERMDRFDFNNETVLNSYSTLYTTPDISIQSYFDLQDKRIAVMKGSINYTGEDGIKRRLKNSIFMLSFWNMILIRKCFRQFRQAVLTPGLSVSSSVFVLRKISISSVPPLFSTRVSFGLHLPKIRKRASTGFPHR
ncbi:MAG: transporter substrate-binding domain-containing protein [Desulfobacteraceae bacterium]|nr:transporter substrate-binding domain-containing protein [Desulfobacteraceae bacterium]